MGIHVGEKNSSLEARTVLVMLPQQLHCKKKMNLPYEHDILLIRRTALRRIVD